MTTTIDQTRPPKSSAVPQAIIKWPHGLDSQPVVMPIGESFEESQAINDLLERALGGTVNGR
jgi:hypothetical protein